MITRSELSVHTINNLISWQEQLARAITSPEQLLTMLDLDSELLPEALRASSDFALRVPYSYVARMERGNPEDPLLKQILPVGRECDNIEGYGLDPLAEQSQNPCNGVIHKYSGRLLLVTSSACAVNCRFCFRRHYPYSDNQLAGENWQKALDYIASDSSIHEVILSGGDPLAANDKRLRIMAEALNAIDHVKTLRIHSRFPVVIPERITDEMISWFTGQRFKPVMVVHCNHANEIDSSVIAAMNKLRESGVTLLNQSVLLKDINDNADALVDLSHGLFDAGILPYYLHVLDPVQGAAHFDVPDETAKQLVKEVAARCSGYLVPKLVREIPGQPGKTRIG